MGANPEPVLHLRVFVSSPGDVSEERKIALDVIERLDRETLLAGKVKLTAVAYDDPEDRTPFTAGRRPQEDVNRFKPRPSECDITVVILWGRLGSLLDTEAFRKPDGSPYASGTEWEIEDARAADNEVLVYFRAEEPTITLKDPQRAEKEKQYDAVCAFRNGFRNPDGSFGRGYNEYKGAEEFRRLLKTHLERLIRNRLEGTAAVPLVPRKRSEPALPRPPELYSPNPYLLQATAFVGRKREMSGLDRWARSKDPVMVLEAIGGVGKSALSWEWTTRAKDRFEGEIWWNFYEARSSLESFIDRATAYVMEAPLEAVRSELRETREEKLLLALRQRPFLLVLDGLERILIAYHRLDAAQLSDGTIATRQRNCSDVRDGAFLSRLPTCQPSRVLITSRLMPAELESQERPVPGVRLQPLGDWDPDDALEFMHLQGIKGSARAIKKFNATFGNHSLLVGILCGQLLKYRKAPGNFDAWLKDPRAGGMIDAADLTRRTQILNLAFEGLSPHARALLSRISVFRGAVGYEAIEAINPALASGQAAGDPAAAEVELDAALTELGDRGLLRWDRESNTYDMHPVVRSRAFEVLDDPDRRNAFDRMRDHFQKSPAPKEQARDVTDLKAPLEVYRALVGAGRLDEAGAFYIRDLATTLVQRLAAYPTVCELLGPLFRDGVDNPPALTDVRARVYVMNDLAIACQFLGRHPEARSLYESAVRADLDNELALGDCLVHVRSLAGYAETLSGRFAGVELAMALVDATGDEEQRNATLLDLAGLRIVTGAYDEAERLLAQITPVEDPDPAVYSPCSIDKLRCRLRFNQGRLTQELLERAQAAAAEQRSPADALALLELEGEWLLEQGKARLAIERFQKALVLLRRSGLPEGVTSGWLSLALAKAGERAQARRTLDDSSPPPYLEAEIRFACGDVAEARRIAVAEFESAWGEGPPFCWWQRLTRMRTLLERLGVPEPSLPERPTVAPTPPFAEEIRLYVAKHRWRQEADELRSKVGQACREGGPDVSAALRRLRDLSEGGDAKVAGARSSALADAIWCAGRDGHPEEMRDLLSELEAVCESDPSARVDALLAGLQNAILWHAQRSSRSECEAGVRRLAELAERSPERQAVREALADGLSRLASAHVRAGDLEAARQDLDRIDRLVAAHPSESPLLDKLAAGILLASLWAPEGIRGLALTEELWRAEALVTRHPDMRAARKALATCLVELVGLQTRAGRSSDAQATLGRLERQVKDDPDDSELLGKLAEGLARASDELGNLRILDTPSSPLERLETLATRHPGDDGVQASLASALQSRVWALGVTHRYDELEVRMRQLEELARSNADNQAIEESIAGAIANASIVYGTGGLREESEAYLHRIRAKAEQSPSPGPFRDYFAVALWSGAESATDAGRPREAERLLDELRTLSSSAPRRLPLARRLAEALSSLAARHALAGDEAHASARIKELEALATECADAEVEAELLVARFSVGAVAAISGVGALDPPALTRMADALWKVIEGGGLDNKRVSGLSARVEAALVGRQIDNAEALVAEWKVNANPLWKPTRYSVLICGARGQVAEARAALTVVRPYLDEAASATWFLRLWDHLSAATPDLRQLREEMELPRAALSPKDTRPEI